MGGKFLSQFYGGGGISGRTQRERKVSRGIGTRSSIISEIMIYISRVRLVHKSR